MKRIPLCAVAALVLLIPRARAADPVAVPESPAGRLASAYFAAYNAGEAEMRAFFERYVAAADLAQRPVEERLGRWRQMRSNLGRLTPQRVLESQGATLEMEVLAEGGRRVRFVIQCQPDPPHLLRSVLFEDTDEGPAMGGPPPPPPTGPPPTDAEIVTRLQAELDSLSRAGQFSGVALLDKDGKTLFSRAYGMASRETKRANTMSTRFDLASVGKAFTTVAVHQLAAAGKLGLDDPVTRHLEDYPDTAARSLTIRMLLEHRGGVPDVMGSPELWRDPTRVRTVSDWYRLVRDRPLEFAPGTRSRYSNGGYVLLGMIIERVSGEDYYDTIRRHVYAPAGMEQTDSYAADALPRDIAIPYTREDTGPHGAGAPTTAGSAEPRAVTVHLGRGSPAGGGYSTAGDLVRFARALRAGKLLDAGRVQGLIGAASTFGIAGGSPGVNTLLELRGPYTLVVLANQDPPAAERFAATTGRAIAHAAAARSTSR